MLSMLLLKLLRGFQCTLRKLGSKKKTLIQL